MKSLLKRLFLVCLLALPLSIFALTVNHCSESIWTSQGWIQIEWSYATDDNGNNYNFGTAAVFFEGEYLGSIYFGGGSGSNINDYLSCQNQI